MTARYTNSAIAFYAGIGTDLVPVTPDDNNDLPEPGLALRLSSAGVTGTVRVVTLKGATRDIEMEPREVIPVEVTRVLATGTTANGIEVFVR